MNCCEQTGTGAKCHQGRDCPVRSARAAEKAASAGEAYPLPIWYAGDEPADEAALSRAEHVGFWLFITLLCLLLVAVLSGGMGYLLDRWWP